MGNDETIAKYEEWIRELERRKAASGGKKNLWWMLAGAAVTAPIAYHWGAVAAAFDVTFWVFLFVASLYLMTMHGWENDRQLEHARQELDDLLEREGGRGAGRAP